MAIDGTPATCTATVTRTWTTGDATCTAESYVETQDGAATCTATVDRALLTASLLRQRRGTAAVRIGGETMDRLVGTVVVEESLESPVPTASFELLDERLARSDRATLTWGERPVEIDFVTGAGALETWRAFEGHVESAENDGAYVPRGSIRASGKAAEWAGDKGCVRLGAFSGYRRGGVLKLLADSLGVTITNAEIESMGAEVFPPVELNGVTLIEQAQRFGEIEGWSVRVTPEGAMELVTEAEATTGPSMYDFEPSNYYAIHETLPSRPVTHWILSGPFVPTEFIEAGALQTTISTVEGMDEDGNPWKTVTRVTTDRGVEVYTEVEEWKTVAADGVTTGPEMLQIAKLTKVTTRWVGAIFGDGRFHYTTSMWQRETEVWELSGTPCSLTYGYEWLGGGRYVEERAALIRTALMTEEWTWYPADDALAHRRCTLATYTAHEQRYYSPRVATGLGNEYPGDIWRHDAWYVFQEVVTVFERWQDSRDQVPPSVVASRDIFSFVYVTSGLPEGEHRLLGDKRRESWTDDGSGAGHWHMVEKGRSTSKVETPYEWTIDVREHADGPVPGPQTGSIATAQLQQRVAVDSFDASPGLPFTRSSQSEVIEGLSSSAELRPIALRRLRTALGAVVDVRHPIIPGLKLADPVTITGLLRTDGGRVRSLSSARAYVTGLRRSQELLNGRGEQTTRVLVLPEWPT